MDYEIWGKLQECVYRTGISDVDHLVKRVVEEWSRFNHEIISSAVTQWIARLHAYVKADRGYFDLL